MLKDLAKQLFSGSGSNATNLTGDSEYTTDVLNGFVSNTSSTLDQQNLLLMRSSVAYAYQQAAFLPSPEKSPILPDCDEDILPICSDSAAHVLTEALKKQYSGVVWEWLHVAQAKGIRPCPRILPHLLAHGCKFSTRRGFIRKAIGARGKWLANFNTEWEWVISSALDGLQNMASWETGSTIERLSYLVGLRNKEPLRVHELLADEMKGEQPKTRASFVHTLKTNLSPADEDFLETMLDDRHASVRRAAADLLIELPSSRLVQRMINRLQDCIKIDKRMLRRTINVDLPEDISESMKRDGISDKTISGHGVAASRLIHLISSTPLGCWTDHTQLEITEILALVNKSEWRKAIFNGLTEAARRQKNKDWLFALLTAKNSTEIKIDRNILLAAIPDEDVEDWINQHISEKNLLELNALLDSSPEESPLYWSVETGQRLIAVITNYIKRSQEGWRLRPIFNSLAEKLHPDLLEDALLKWPERHKNWDLYFRHMDTYFEIIQLRKDLHRELKI